MSDPKRGEVWNANFSPATGHEQKGYRPALILSDDRLNSSPAELVIAVPVTTTKRGIPWHVQINAPDGGLRETSYALCEQVRAISKKRLRSRRGMLQGPALQEVEDRVQVLLGL